MKKIIDVSATLFATVAFSVNATQVFDLEGFGAISRSMGGTSAAYYTGNAALISNPATLAFAPEGQQLELGLDLVTTDINSTNSDREIANSQTTSNNRGPYYAPQISFVTQYQDWRFGVGLYANGGLGTEFGSDSFLSRTENGTQTSFENSSRLLVLRVPFGFSYQFSPELTFGASVDMVWTALNLELLLPASQVGALAMNNDLSGSLVSPLAGFIGGTGAAHFSLSKNDPVGGGVDAVGLAGRVGMTYRLSAQTMLGASYNFETSVGDLTGNATLTAIDGSANTLPLNGDIRFRDFEMPASLTVGTSHQFNERLLLTIDLRRTFWSDVFSSIQVGFTSAAGNIAINLPQNYQDITVYAVGAAYQYNDKLTLRSGFSYAEQAQDINLLFPVIPAYLKRHLTVGGEYRLDSGSAFNFALSFGLKETLQTPSYMAGNEFLTQSHSQVNAVFSYTHQF